MPDTWYVDTTGEPGRTYAYAVAAVPEVTATRPLSAPVTAASKVPGAGDPTVDLTVDADGERHAPAPPVEADDRQRAPEPAALPGPVRRPRDRPGASRRAAAHPRRGRRRNRAGARDPARRSRPSTPRSDGEPVIDFTSVDRVYDLLIETGLRPVVEIGFMPRDLASDPAKTVFDYRGIISPPKDWDRWGDLIRALVTHLLDRYGDEVLGWDFEVWNEANLDVFWSGTRDEWMRLYDVTVRAVKDVDPRIPVGGPSSAAAGWVDALLEHTRKSGAPVDFVSTHTYGSPPLDLRPTLARYGLPDARILWTEWGVTPTHFHPVNDGTSAATFLLSGMRSAAGRVDALSYWVASDHFEELGRPPRLLHGGFGLITVGGIAKPRYHALRMLAQPRRHRTPGAQQRRRRRRSGAGLGQPARRTAAWRCWCGRPLWTSPSATVDPALARRVRLALSGAAGRAVTVTRLDRDHGDITTLARELGVGAVADRRAVDGVAGGRLAARRAYGGRGRRRRRGRRAPPAPARCGARRGRLTHGAVVARGRHVRGVRALVRRLQRRRARRPARRHAPAAVHPRPRRRRAVAHAVLSQPRSRRRLRRQRPPCGRPAVRHAGRHGRPDRRGAPAGPAGDRRRSCSTTCRASIPGSGRPARPGRVRRNGPGSTSSRGRPAAEQLAVDLQGAGLVAASTTTATGTCTCSTPNSPT